MTPHFPHYRTKSALTAALVRTHLKPHRRTPLYGVRGVRCGSLGAARNGEFMEQNFRTTGAKVRNGFFRRNQEGSVMLISQRNSKWMVRYTPEPKPGDRYELQDQDDLARRMKDAAFGDACTIRKRSLVEDMPAVMVAQVKQCQRLISKGRDARDLLGMGYSAAVVSVASGMKVSELKTKRRRAPRRELIMALMSDGKTRSRDEIETALGWGYRASRDLVREIVNRGELVMVAPPKSGRNGGPAVYALAQEAAA